MSYIVSLLVVVIVITLRHWKSISEYFEKHAELSKIPKIPLGHYPVVGHLFSLKEFGTNFFDGMVSPLLKMALENKKLALLDIGVQRFIWLIHPDSAEVILKNTKNISKSPNYRLLQPLVGHGLIVSNGDKWRKRRKMITPTFHHEILKDFLSVMNEQAGVLVNKIDNCIDNHQDVDILKFMKLCTLDIICETAMGCKVNAQEKENSEYVVAFQRWLQCFRQRRFNLLYRCDFTFNLTSLGKEHNDALTIIHEFARKVIAKKMSEPRSDKTLGRRTAFLDMLIAAETEDHGQLTLEDIKEEVDTFMFAGHDTTSLAVTWGIYVLGRNPDKQKLLQQELDSVFGSDRSCDVTLDHIKDLPYLDLVVKEVLRMYPSAPLIGRTVDEEIEIDGVKIPKGETVNIFIFLINRHPDIWKNPDEFRPERFSHDNRSDRRSHPYSYIPFSAGARNCVGQRFALQEQKVLLAKFFRSFSVVSLDHEKEIQVEPGLMLQIDGNLRLEITKRTD